MRTKSDIFYAAMLARDARFDGKFFIGVKTTGIYCRPICPARPQQKNVEFFQDALSAEKAGYRPCLRCRPECAPRSAAWLGKSAVVQRALKLISDNKLIDKSEDQFAELLGVSARHLRRLFEEEVGKTPKQIADLQRLDFARRLVVETSIPFTDIAGASGFSSIRRFNDAVKRRFSRSPTLLRKIKATPSSDKGIQLVLPYRPPLDWASLIRFYQGHQIAGVEAVSDSSYERVFELHGEIGGLRLELVQKTSELKVHIVTPSYKHLFQIVQRVRQMFDLDSDPLLITDAFASSSFLSDLSVKYPGLRVPKGWDGFETATSSILGQLVSTEQAQRLVKQLVEKYGKKVVNPLTQQTLSLFPSSQILAQETLQGIGTTQSRKNTIRELSQKVLEGRIQFDSSQDPQAFRKALLEIKGIGLWTAEYISLRALGDPDAFPHTDLILKRALELHPNLQLENIKPWRAYAAMYLWKEYAAKLSNKGKKRKENK